MKKNWLSYICVATLLSGALTSCNESNFLDLSDPNHFTENNFWKKLMQRAVLLPPTHRLNIK